MKKLCFAILSLFVFIPQIINAGTPLVAGHALTDGQIIVGVTGSAPVANRLVGTANQISVTQGAEGGNFALSLPTSVTVQNLTVTGTLSPYSTGTFTSDNLTANYGVSAATGVFSGAVSAATFNSGQGANELYAMDQNVMTTDAVSFARLALSGNISAVSGTFSGGITMGGVLNVTGTVNAAASVNVTSNVTSGGFFNFNPTSAQEIVQVTPTVSGASLFCMECHKPVWFQVGVGWLFADGTSAP